MQNRHTGMALAFTVALLAAPACASSITNLADIPYDLNVVIAGKEQSISIDPGRKWSSDAYPIYVYVKKQRVRLDPSAEYAIWKDGSFTQQRRNMLDHGK